jgi:hypothetical protein
VAVGLTSVPCSVGAAIGGRRGHGARRSSSEGPARRARTARTRRPPCPDAYLRQLTPDTESVLTTVFESKLNDRTHRTAYRYALRACRAAHQIIIQNARAVYALSGGTIESSTVWNTMRRRIYEPDSSD